jgi:hypothetical protein
MTTPSFRDVEQLSAYLDGRLSQVEKTRLEARLQADPTLEALWGDLRNARSTLRRTPKHSVPRNFTISPRPRPPVFLGIRGCSISFHHYTRRYSGRSNILRDSRPHARLWPHDQPGEWSWWWTGN